MSEGSSSTPGGAHNVVEALRRPKSGGAGSDDEHVNISGLVVISQTYGCVGNQGRKENAQFAAHVDFEVESRRNNGRNRVEPLRRDAAKREAQYQTCPLGRH
jgi:hypothetical protein